MNASIFQDSIFLQSLGWAIAHSIWQGGLLWILFNILASPNSNVSAKFRNYASTISLFITFVWFISTFLSRLVLLQNNVAGNLEKSFIFSFGLQSSPGNINLLDFISNIAVTLPYLSVAYLVLLVIFTIKLVNSYRNTNFIKHNGLQKPPIDWRLFVQKVSMHMGIQRKVKLWFSLHVDVPATIGFLKPVILIPVASLNQLTVSQLEAIILHELSHIKRNDFLVNILISVIETILFFNPFVALLGKVTKKERENCCDDFVLQYQYDRHSYASALLSLEKNRYQHHRLALTATSGKRQLLLRIQRIIGVKNSTGISNYGQKLLALLVLTGIICSVAWLSPAKKSLPKIVNNDAFAPYAVNQHHKVVQQPAKRTGGFTAVDKITNNPAVKRGTIPVRPPVTGNLDVPKIDKQVPKAFIYTNPEETAGISFSADNKDFPQSFEYSFKHSAGKGKDFVPDLNLNFAAKSNALLNLSFNVDVNKIKEAFEKNAEAFSKIDWDKMQKDVLQGLDKLKIPAFEFREDGNWGAVPPELYNIDQKKAEAMVQLHLLDKVKLDVDLSRTNMAANLVNILINNDCNISNREDRVEGRKLAITTPAKRRQKPVIANSPGSLIDHVAAADDRRIHEMASAAQSSVREALATINDRTIVVKDKKHSSADVIHKSGHEQFSVKKILIDLNNSLQVISSDK